MRFWARLPSAFRQHIFAGQNRGGSSRGSDHATVNSETARRARRPANRAVARPTPTQQSGRARAMASSPGERAGGVVAQAYRRRGLDELRTVGPDIERATRQGVPAALTAWIAEAGPEPALRYKTRIYCQDGRRFQSEWRWNRRIINVLHKTHDLSASATCCACSRSLVSASPGVSGELGKLADTEGPAGDQGRRLRKQMASTSLTRPWPSGDADHIDAGGRVRCPAKREQGFAGRRLARSLGGMTVASTLFRFEDS